MAKSLRSKSRRRNAAAKREKYSKKELERLKIMLGITEEAAKRRKIEIMEDVRIIKNSLNGMDDKDGSSPKKTPPKSKAPPKKKGKNNSIDAEMEDSDKKTNGETEMDVDKQTKVYDPKTLRDEHGQYPVWVHPRKIKAKKGQKKGKKGQNKVTKKKGKSRKKKN